jgi:hypothetical protein
MIVWLRDEPVSWDGCPSRKTPPGGNRPAVQGAHRPESHPKYSDHCRPRQPNAATAVRHPFRPYNTVSRCPRWRSERAGMKSFSAAVSPRWFRRMTNQRLRNIGSDPTGAESFYSVFHGRMRLGKRLYLASLAGPPAYERIMGSPPMGAEYAKARLLECLLLCASSRAMRVAMGGMTLVAVSPETA